MSRTEYYERLKLLAAEKRIAHGVTTSGLGLAKLRAIYKAEGIVIDLRKLPPKIRAVYMCDDDDPSVLVNSNLPEEPRIFSMAHELKHHFLDRELIAAGTIRCGDYNANEEIEKGAEVFAAEFIFPEAEFLELTTSLSIPQGKCPAERVVELKRACPAKVSYKFLSKRLERLGFADKGSFDSIQWKKLEEQLYGVPYYKQQWYKDRRTAKSGQHRSR